MQSQFLSKFQSLGESCMHKACENSVKQVCLRRSLTAAPLGKLVRSSFPPPLGNLCTADLLRPGLRPAGVPTLHAMRLRHELK